MPKRPAYIPIFLDDIALLEPLDYEARGRLLTALLEYARDGETDTISGNERFAFPAFKGAIDRLFTKYAETCERNRANVGRRYADSEPTKPTTVDDRMRPSTKSTNRNRNLNRNPIEIESEIGIQSPASAPSADETKGATDKMRPQQSMAASPRSRSTGSDEAELKAKWQLPE